MKASLMNLLSEVTQVKFKGQIYNLQVDTNEDPKKKGIKIKFIPASLTQISPEEQNDIAISLEQKLEPGLLKHGMKIERDRELRDPSIIGFMINLEYIDRIIRQALQGAE